MPAITTDVIVGFPGETDADFAATCRVCEEVGFSKIHIFPFSPRRGTPAADLPDQVPPEIKAARGRSLAELERQLRQRYYEGLAGRQLDVLIEGAAAERGPASTDGRLAGTSCRYAPVELPAGQACVGDLARVAVTGVAGEYLLAEVAS